MPNPSNINDRTNKINSPDKEENMKKSTIRKILAAMVVMTLFVVALIIPTSAEEPTEKVYVLDATADLAAFSQGAKADGDAEKAGTDNFCTVKAQDCINNLCAVIIISAKLFCNSSGFGKT